MADTLQYVATQVAPYLVATVGRLFHVISDFRERVVGLEEEKHKFKGR